MRSIEEARSDIDDWLREGGRIALWSDYRHEARRHFEERRLNLAVILINSALEVLWAELINAGLQDQGDDPEAASKTVNRLFEGRRLIEKLDPCFRKVFGRSLKEEQPDLWNGLKKARELRANVIHPWLKSPGLDETFECMRSVELAIRWLFECAFSQAGSVDVDGETELT